MTTRIDEASEKTEILIEQEWEDSILRQAEDAERLQPQIKRAPWLRLEKELKEHFEPMLVSIGPYHHGDARLQPMEKLKPLVAKKFLEGKQIADVFRVFEAEIRKRGLMEYYDTEFVEKKTESKFTRLMFLDGCFVLHFIESLVQKKFMIHSEINTYKAFLEQDLLLMENQLPFVVLDALISQFDENEKERKLKRIYEFIRDNTGAIKPTKKDISVKESSDLLGDPNRQPLHLLEVLRAHLIGLTKEKTKQTKMQSDKPRYRKHHLIRGAEEIMEVGIRIKPSKESNLQNVDFKAYALYSQLTLPAMTVDDSTKRKLLNLIAYEMSYEHIEEKHVISYVCFMDSLIDSAEDVKALRRASVLNNFLASESAVASLFNSIAHDLVPDLVYEEVERHIQDHFRKGWTTWVAQVMNQHFSTPWTVVGFLAACIALTMTIIETYFSVFPRGGRKPNKRSLTKDRPRNKLLG